MNTPLVLTIIGKDRPGLVETIARLVADHGGNWLESRMCRLGGEFAGILRIHIPSTQQAGLETALSKNQELGLYVTLQRDPGVGLSKPGRIARLEIVGHDRPGIVRDISAALAKRQVNVEEFQSECLPAPMSGEVLFKASIEVNIPAECIVADLRRDLETVAGNLLVDMTFEECSPAASKRPGLN